MPDQSTGRRVHQRFSCELPVTLRIADQEISALATNIGLGGVFLTMADTGLAYGTEGAIDLKLPALHEPARIQVTVRWVVPEGIGLQFGSLRALEVWGLNEYFKTLSEGA